MVNGNDDDDDDEDEEKNMTSEISILKAAQNRTR